MTLAIAHKEFARTNSLGLILLISSETTTNMQNAPRRVSATEILANVNAFQVTKEKDASAQLVQMIAPVMVFAHISRIWHMRQFQWMPVTDTT